MKSSNSAITRIKTVTIVVIIILIILIGVYAYFYNLGLQSESKKTASIPVSPSPSLSPLPSQNFFSPGPSPSLTITPIQSPSPSPTPSPSPNPMLSVINPIRGLIQGANSSFSYSNSSLFLRGKVLVWDMRIDKEVIDVESLLASELVAKSPDENLTIFAIVNSDQNYSYQLIEVYWPEKEIAGYNDLYNYVDPNLNINRLTAGWINSLPRRDFIPKTTMIANVQGLILDAQSSYQSLPNSSSLTVYGKVLVWNFAKDKEAFDVESLLPSELLASSLNDNVTLFAIVNQSEKIVGHYSNGWSAIQKSWDILALQWPENEVIGRHTVFGEDPPFIISVRQGDTTGSASGDINRPTAKWILSLPR